MTPRRSPAVHAVVARLAEVPVTLVLAAACIALLAWVEVHGSSREAATLVRFGALERGRVWSGEPWRLLTAPFLHAGWIHLGWNLAFGFLSCGLLERALGSRPFALVWLASALGASSLSLLLQDVVSAGASGPLFGTLGAALALHRRTLGSWRSFLASPPTRWALALAVGFSAAASLFVQLDHLAHVGGLLAGAAAAWLLSRPPPARDPLPWAGFAAVLVALVVAACWPRATLTRFGAAELEGALHAALRAHDPAAARRLVERAEAGHHHSERLRYYRALLLVQENDLGGAIELARGLRRAEEPAVREGAAELARGIARTLGYRHYTGDGARRDPWLGLSYIEEACALGDTQSCRDAQAISGR
jgi:rhomboid protease GluP